jgi:hypothetical protein
VDYGARILSSLDDRQLERYGRMRTPDREIGKEIARGSRSTEVGCSEEKNIEIRCHVLFSNLSGTTLKTSKNTTS